MSKPLTVLLQAIAVCLLSASARGAGGFGSVEGQFVLEGEIPNRKAVPAVGAAAMCGLVRPLDLVVDPETKGIANILVYLRKAPETIRPDLQKSKDAEVVFDQKSCEFVPRALFVRTDQAVRVKSADPFPHNTRTAPIRNAGANVVIGANDRKGVLIGNPLPESLPFQVECNLHPHMKAFWLVLDHPYAAVTDEQGKFRIEGLPAGEHRFVVWHERVGYIERTYKVDVAADQTTSLQPVSVPIERFKIDD